MADVQTVFPYEPFLNALLSIEAPRSKTSGGAPWLFYFVLTVGENYLGMKYKMCLTRTHTEVVLVHKSRGCGGGCPVVEVASGVGISGRAYLLKDCALGSVPGEGFQAQ